MGWERVKLRVWPLHQGRSGLFGKEASGRPEVLRDEGPVGSQGSGAIKSCGGETKVIRCL